MIILKCPCCGSYDISFGSYVGSFKCQSCSRIWELYEIKQVHVIPAGSPAKETSAATLPALQASTTV